MKRISVIAAIGCLMAMPAGLLTPASAYVVSKSVSVRHGYFGHGCRTVRTTTRGFRGTRVVVRRICR